MYAAHELDDVTLANALELTILAAEVGDERWPKLAARWHARFVDETPGIGVAESAFVLAAAGALGGATLRAGARFDCAVEQFPRRIGRAAYSGSAERVVASRLLRLVERRGRLRRGRRLPGVSVPYARA
jgi:hypothetical protein